MTPVGLDRPLEPPFDDLAGGQRSDLHPDIGNRPVELGLAEAGEHAFEPGSGQMTGQEEQSFPSPWPAMSGIPARLRSLRAAGDAKVPARIAGAGQDAAISGIGRRSATSRPGIVPSPSRTPAAERSAGPAT